MMLLKQSTAATIKLGPFVDSTDAVTAETGLTISQADIRLSKNGGDIAQSNNSAGATHDELGYYDIPLDTTDTNTLGRLRVMVSESGALPVWAEYMVVPAAVYDSLVSGTGNGPRVDVAAISGDSTAAATLKNMMAGFETGTAQAGASTTITLASTASSTDDYYNGMVVYIFSGTGAKQTRKITDYVGATRVATVASWATAPDNTSVYLVLGRIE